MGGDRAPIVRGMGDWARVKPCWNGTRQSDDATKTRSIEDRLITLTNLPSVAWLTLRRGPCFAVQISERCYSHCTVGAPSERPQNPFVYSYRRVLFTNANLCVVSYDALKSLEKATCQVGGRLVRNSSGVPSYDAADGGAIVRGPVRRCPLPVKHGKRSRAANRCERPSLYEVASKFSVTLHVQRVW